MASRTREPSQARASVDQASSDSPKGLRRPPPAPPQGPSPARGRLSRAAPLPTMAQILGPAGPTVVLFGGKGGVGKTTVACAAAREMARMSPSDPILLVSTDPAHSLGDVLQRPIGPEPVRLAEDTGLWAQELSGGKLLAAFLERNGTTLAKLMARGVLFEQAELEPFFQLSLPGMDEVMGVLSLSDALRCGRFRRIVLDTAPTGHTLRLLRLPAAMQRWTAYLDALQEKHRMLADVFGSGARPGPEDAFLDELAGKLAEVRALLTDPQRSRFVPVANAEPMALAETARLVDGLRGLRVPTGPLVLNRVEAVSGCETCSSRAAQESVALAAHEKLARLAPFVLIPRFGHEVRGDAALADVARYLTGSGARPPSPGAGEPPPQVSGGGGATAPQVSLPAMAPSVKLVLFGGKGGVGKTSLASTYAIGFARSHPTLRVLVLSTDPAHSLSDFFGEPVGPTPRPWSGNPALELQAIDPDRAFQRIKAVYRSDVEKLLTALSERANVNLPAERRVLLELLDLAPPGLDEMMALAGLAKHLRSGRYDLHVLDTAPTGHTLRFLELPELALDWLRSFFALFLRYRRVLPLRNISRSLVELSRDLHAVADLLRDAQGCCFIGVTAPTQVAMAETARLLHALTRLPVRCHGLVVNRVPEPAACVLCAARSRDALEVISAVLDRGVDCPVVAVPEFLEDLRATSPGPVLETVTRTLNV